MNITVDEMMSFSPCEDYSRSRVEGLWGGRESLSASEIASLEIPALDRIWALCQVLGSRDLTSLVAFAQSCADRAKTSETAELTQWSASAALARATRWSAMGTSGAARWTAKAATEAASWAACDAVGGIAGRAADLQISIDELVKRLS